MGDAADGLRCGHPRRPDRIGRPEAMAGISQDAVTVRRLRRGVGVIGIALPFVLVIGHFLFAKEVELLGSMSQYYYSEMRDVFVGAMCAMGAFRICYREARPDARLSRL